MEFIQIIYTSLFIFAGSVIIFLIISFILYKLKKISLGDVSESEVSKQELKPIVNRKRRKSSKSGKSVHSNSRDSLHKGRKKDSKRQEKPTRLHTSSKVESEEKQKIKNTEGNILDHYSDDNHSDDLTPIKITRKK
ncbi:MAG: hypothetical protein K8F36_01840 [Melioribacteraceae bacterium]|nr:hypothetical protein [Melioribacteraceae bacterium]MCO6473160.1 hypothetical protein [Melioribacteraceae bacterium]